MATGALPVERLRAYLRELPSGARTLLVTELERAVLRGDEIPGGDMLLQEVRAAVRDSGARGPRIGNPARMFFRPVEPFLCDVAPERKLPGRLSRAVLEPTWTWIGRDLLPAETKRYCDEIGAALGATDGAAVSIARSFQDLVVERLRAALSSVESDERAQRKMSTQIGTPNALVDLRDILMIISSRDTLESIAGRLPGHIRNLDDGTLENVKLLLDSPACIHRGLQPYALTMVMNRLAAPWQLLRLAVKAAESDVAARVAASSYALAVTITLADIERMVDELKSDRKRGATSAVTSLLKCIHDAVRGVRTELDLPADSPWGRRLAAIRSEISGLLKSEIESVPGRVRRLLRPRGADDNPGSLDADEVDQTDAMIEFISACRNYAGELAISEMTLRIYQDLQQYLDTSTRALLEGLRAAKEADRAFRKSQVDAAIRFCGRAFGQDYALLLTKAAETAIHAESSIAARA